LGGICLLAIGPALGLAATKVTAPALRDYLKEIGDRRNILIVLLIFFYTLHWGAEYVCYGLFLRKELHLSFIGMGWYMSAEFIAIFLTVIIYGLFLSRRGRLHWHLAIGLFWAGLGHIGMVHSGLYGSAAWRAVHGMGDGVMFMAFYIGAARYFSPARMGGTTGVMHISSMLGTIVGGLISGFFADRFSHAWSIEWSGFLMIGLIVPVVLLGRQSSKVFAD